MTGVQTCALPISIYILDGQYKATDRAAFGTTNGITYVDGGTVWSTRSAPTGDNNPATGSEAFHLKGTGYNNLGVFARRTTTAIISPRRAASRSTATFA